MADGRAARYWKIANPGRPNATGEPVAYKLMPQDSVLPFGQPDTHLMRRAQFATRPCGSPRTTLISGSPPASTPTSTPAETACPRRTATTRAEASSWRNLAR